MIKTVADLLKAFTDEERKKLDVQKVRHAPTIGSMYEGLTKELLSKAIPEELGLRVVQGFAFCGERQSGQLDCMLVRGTGDQIPYTDSYRWHVKDVIAVFEVKKTLTGDDLADSYNHLREVSQVYSTYVESEDAQDTKIDLRAPRQAFGKITGVAPPAHEGVGSFPQLIVGGEFALVKANGLPYTPVLMDGCQTTCQTDPVTT